MSDQQIEIRRALTPVSPAERQALVLDDSPLPVARVGLILASLFFVLFLGWAAFARLDAAAVGSGQVTVAGNRQTIQHKDGGVIAVLNVHEGQHVAAHQLLIQLSAPDVIAQERSLFSGVINLQAQQARLEADISGKPIHWPDVFATYGRDREAIVKDAIALQLAQAGARQGSLSASHAINGTKKSELSAQISGFNAQAEAASQQKISLSQQLASTKKLAADGYASTNAVSQLERSVSQLDAERADYVSRAAAARQEIGGASGEDVQAHRKYEEDSASVLRDTQFQLNDLMPKWLAASQQLERTQIRAPVAGNVVGLAVFTPGGVIAPGEHILDIVPDAAPLVIRAQFSPSDIDGVENGRTAEIRFASIHERDLPILNGRVQSVSADALKDERTGASYFTAEVSVPASELAKLRHVRGDDTGVRPGVPVQVFVGLRRRTALQYLLDPLTETFASSFHER